MTVARLATVMEYSDIPNFTRIASHLDYLNILNGIFDCLNSDNKETCDMAYQTVNPANNQH